MSNQLLNFASTDWRGVHYGTYLLLRVLELIFWILGAIGVVAAAIAASYSEKLRNGNTSRPNLGWGIGTIVSILNPLKTTPEDLGLAMTGAKSA